MTNVVTKIPQNPKQVAVSDLKEMSLNYLAMPQVFEAMWRLAQGMAGARSMPEHLQNNPGDCFRIIEYANRIGQSPFALADCSFEVGGKIAYEGKVIAAMVNACPKLDGSLRYDYSGEGRALTVTVSGRLRGEAQDRRVCVTLEQGIADSRGTKSRWGKDPEQMLAYYGARRWARRHTPEVILGMYTYDELRAGAEGGSIIDITPAREEPEARQPVHGFTTPARGEPEPAHDPATGEVHERPADGNGKRHTLPLYYNGKEIEEHPTVSSWMAALRRHWAADRDGVTDWQNLTLLERYLPKIVNDSEREDMDRIMTAMREARETAAQAELV